MNSENLILDGLAVVSYDKFINGDNIFPLNNINFKSIPESSN